MLSARVARAGLRASVQQFSVPRTAVLNGIRTYATPAQDVKPPVALFGIDGTYASALVRDTSNLEAIEPLSFRWSELVARKRTSKITTPRKSQLEKQKEAWLTNFQLITVHRCR